MEIKFVIALGVMLVIIISIVMVVSAIREDNKLIFVYPKTGHKYKLLGKCRMKCPVTREWRDAVIYKGLDDGGKYYVREEGDFWSKFVKLKYWKDGADD